ncbi:MAG: hypothetical protein LM522_03100, partial [Candidatus Contendobacter sp.]|nr:hypothetical protein [Candidatus Contendobacter sp.]
PGQWKTCGLLQCRPSISDRTALMDQRPRSRAARPFPKTLTYRIEGDVLKLALVGKRNDDDIYPHFERLH